jgi:6-pyruvoyltetrahydropterin/6-carboxytetrahydropterin synthase
MYTLAVRRDFIASHFLIGGDWGSENHPHEHHYILELQLSGRELDKHGYLVDIVDVEKHLEETIARYRNHLLNEQPEFAGLNPSLEHFCRIICSTLNKNIKAPNISALKVILWENEIAWASYTLERAI